MIIDDNRSLKSQLLFFYSYVFQLLLKPVIFTCVGLLHRVTRGFLFRPGSFFSANILLFSFGGEPKPISNPESDELDNSSKAPSLQNEYSEVDMVRVLKQKNKKIYNFYKT